MSVVFALGVERFPSCVELDDALAAMTWSLIPLHVAPVQFNTNSAGRS
ncbi:MAG TPA: hypothetical protein VN495_00295 [Candidatus Paceibacterota bacterium]|nr:hypothetical protein [Candidatus Paceibacterota bacterium]